jgi:hypothetical protein
MALLLMLGVAGCAASGVAVPSRAVDVDANTAMVAQGKLGNLMMGNVEWTESEFSSFLSFLLAQNSGDNNPVTGITVWFEPDNQIFVRVGLKDGVIPVGNSLDLAGSIAVVDHHVMVDIDQAGAGSMSVSGALLAPISAQINAALSDPNMGVAANVSTDTGMVMVTLGM